ncbi:MFS transporter [Yinghuangia aomiensis]
MRVDRAWLGLGLLVLPTFLVAMDMTALLLALSQLSADLGADSVQQLWISDSYGLMVAGLVITMGTLGDRIGRRRLLMIGAAAFAVLSVVAAFSTSPEMLIVVRALLGVAGATLAPSTLALITNMFRDDRQRGKAIAIWATGQFAGGALGPVLAGLLLQHFWWGSVFLAAVPAMLLLLVAAPILLPEFRSDHAGRLDPASVALSLASVLPMIYGIKQLAVANASAGPAVALIAGAAIGVVFVRRQLRLATPLLDLRLLRNRPFTAVLVGLVLAGIAMAGTGLLVTQYLQSVLGYSPRCRRCSSRRWASAWPAARWPPRRWPPRPADHGHRGRPGRVGARRRPAGRRRTRQRGRAAAGHRRDHRPGARRRGRCSRWAPGWSSGRCRPSAPDRRRRCRRPATTSAGPRLRVPRRACRGRLPRPHGRHVRDRRRRRRHRPHSRPTGARRCCTTPGTPSPPASTSPAWSRRASSSLAAVLVATMRPAAPTADPDRAGDSGARRGRRLGRSNGPGPVDQACTTAPVARPEPWCAWWRDKAAPVPKPTTALVRLCRDCTTAVDAPRRRRPPT